MECFELVYKTFTKDDDTEERMTLAQADVRKEYIVKDIKADDEELLAFLFSLGCYSGEPITVVSRKKSGCIVAIKDGRYIIDKDLAEAIQI